MEKLAPCDCSLKPYFLRLIGKQSIPASGPHDLTYGKSVTDACINWDTTVVALDKLRKGVQARRQRVAQRSNSTGDVNGLADSISSLKSVGDGLNDEFLTKNAVNGALNGFNDQHLPTLGKGGR